MRVAAEAVEISPGLAAAVARDIGYLDWNVEQLLRLDDFNQRARRAVQTAAGWRARDDLDFALRAPRAARIDHTGIHIKIRICVHETIK